MPGWWCGPADTKAVDHSTLTPCTAETAGSPVMLLIAAVVLYVQLNRVRLLKRHRSYLGLGNYGIIEAFVAAVLVALTVSHTGWLIFYIVQRQAAYHYLYEAVMATYWAAALVRCLLSLLSTRHPAAPTTTHCVHCRQWYGKAGRTLSQCTSSSSFGQRQLYIFGRCTPLYKFTWDTGTFKVLWNAFCSLQPPAFKPSWPSQRLSRRRSSKLDTLPTLLAMYTLHCQSICPAVEFGVRPFELLQWLAIILQDSKADSKGRALRQQNLLQLLLSSMHHCYSASLHCCGHLLRAVPRDHPSLLCLLHSSPGRTRGRPFRTRGRPLREHSLPPALTSLLQASPGRRRGHPSRGSPCLRHRSRGSRGQLQKAAA